MRPIVLLVLVPWLAVRQPCIDSSKALVSLALNNEDLETAERKSQYLYLDFSPLFNAAPDAVRLGYTGSNFQRLRVKFLTVKKSTVDSVYQVQGRTLVNGALRDFEGTLTVQHIRLFKRVKLQVDELTPSDSISKVGVTVGRFSFREQQTLGLLTGSWFIGWYLNEKDELRYDNLQSISDEYANNQFSGSYRSQNGDCLLINWGDYRIPFSRDLDVGAGEFGVNEKYLGSGWQTHHDAYIKNDAKARAIERGEWWK